MTKNGSKKPIKAISVTSVICGFLWLIFLIMYISNYSYKYLFLLKPRNLLARTIPNLLLPMGSFILSILFSLLDKQRCSKICCILFFVLLVFSSARSSSEILYAPAFCSATSNPDHFASYDDEVEEFLLLNPPFVGFPQEIPVDAENIQYRYFYCNSSTETIFVAISWDNRHDQVNSDSVTEICGDLIELHTDSAAKTAVYYDEHNHRITYMLTNHEKYLPIHSNEAYTIVLE